MTQTTKKMWQELAVIKDINVGMRDCDEPVCWFEAVGLNGNSLQILSLDQMKYLIKETGVYSLSKLNGTPIVIETDGWKMVYLGPRKVV